MHTATNQSSSLASALLCVQQALQPAAKDGKNPYHATRYATLNSVMASCRELLISHGILLTQMPVVQPVELGQNVLALETRLTHVDTGEYLASTAIVPLPKADPQGLGSAITYARRYALCAILGIITEDDDGNAASCLENRQAPNVTAGPKKARSLLASLPKLDGVSYSMATSSEGRTYVVAVGGTMEKKVLLQKAGFRWDNKQRCWWRYADIENQDSAQSCSL